MTTKLQKAKYIVISTFDRDEAYLVYTDADLKTVVKDNFEDGEYMNEVYLIGKKVEVTTKIQVTIA